MNEIQDNVSLTINNAQNFPLITTPFIDWLTIDYQFEKKKKGGQQIKIDHNKN